MRRAIRRGGAILCAALLTAAGASAESHQTPASAAESPAEVTADSKALDATAALVCDLTEAAQCDGVAACVDVTPEQIDLPPTIVVDFDAGQLAAEDAGRTSPITGSTTLDGVLLLQGSGEERGWTIVIDRATGHLSASLTDAAGSFVIAGACTRR